MALPRESHSGEIRSKNKQVYENAVTGIKWSCVLLLIGSPDYLIWFGNEFGKGKGRDKEKGIGLRFVNGIFRN